MSCKKIIVIAVVWCVCVFPLESVRAEGVRAAISGQNLVCRVETDRAVLPAGSSQDVVLKITLDAPPVPGHVQRPPVNLSLVLDQSGSMGGVKIEQAKAAAVEALRRLGQQDIFSVVVYDSNVATIVPAQHAQNVQGIIRMIDQIRAGGSTALFGGVSQGASEIRKHIEEDFIHRIVLLSDGLANVGPRMPEDLGRLGAALIKENISVSTVGVGTDYNEDLMARLARESDGNTYFVESGYDLPGIFAAELGDVLNVVAKQVKVTVTLPEDVTAVEIIGREGRIRGQKIELFMNQLYGDQEKYALIKVKIPPSAAGTKRKIAQADVKYENPFSKKIEQSSGISYASFSQDSKKITESTNVDVVKEYQLNLNALAQEKAIALSDKGQKKEAVQELKKSAARLKSMGAQYKDERLLDQADALEVQAQKIEEKGMTKKDRKILRTESYQQLFQQKSQE
ncbi:MAG: VWA domain-containing protein [Proteobacteria bacterium]|nr:VWA domain-containing protein [Pseudomonadota bacterium]MBU1388460.1 VWA domain-containing protein [Pseudomonadota bacterium]MBU1542716.1 VWA domain-containing protein [Pseudomonadota bacterium]MBU2430041.1 VWA domain-containing protein [Pseudomonadota bacterium]MBU2481250.1 VWA domain-containing protein [Pseudomonadota bacterium]